MLSQLLLAGLLLPLLLLLLLYSLRVRSIRRQRGQFTVGFFHPFCNSGGGGERVLWQYVRHLQSADPSQRILIYTGDAEPAAEILQRCQERFGLRVEPTVEFVRLRLRFLVTAAAWPRFTLVGQSLGAVVLAAEALFRSPAALFIDTTGFAFTYPLARYAFAAQVHCYTHYPTISEDMLRVVFERRPAHNNSGAVSRSLLLARVKWVYYKLFALAYAAAGRAAHLAFVNSTWTRGHIDSLWSLPDGRIHTVYPPCDTKGLQSIPLGVVTPFEQLREEKEAEERVVAAGLPVRENLIMSLAQFRPEKDHALQLRAFALFLQQLKSQCQERDVSVPRMTLALLGGVRDEGDQQRVAELRRLATELGIEESVRFELNQPASVVRDYLSRSTVALHTMWNEHFGIGVVEFMAAG
jgi:alpha-1,2-mannosyltransferase